MKYYWAIKDKNAWKHQQKEENIYIYVCVLHGTLPWCTVYIHMLILFLMEGGGVESTID